MQRTLIYIIAISLFALCTSHTRTEDISAARHTLMVADSLAQHVSAEPFADTLALIQAYNTFSTTDYLAEHAKACYYLAGAYKTYGNDSVAFEYYKQAANDFLQTSDSVYYPLTIIELHLLAEQQYNEADNITYLEAIRTLQRELAHSQQQQHSTKGLLRIILAVIFIIIIVAATITIIFLRRQNNRHEAQPLSRDDLERSITTLLDQGKVQQTLNWHDYTQMCRVANAYMFSFVDKLLATNPDLTEQEVRFLTLVMLDLPGKEIADIMNLSPNSISNKKTRTAQKLGTIAASLRETLISITLNSSKQ